MRWEQSRAKSHSLKASLSLHVDHYFYWLSCPLYSFGIKTCHNLYVLHAHSNLILLHQEEFAYILIQPNFETNNRFNSNLVHIKVCTLLVIMLLLWIHDKYCNLSFTIYINHVRSMYTLLCYHKLCRNEVELYICCLNIKHNVIASFQL